MHGTRRMGKERRRRDRRGGRSASHPGPGAKVTTGLKFLPAGDDRCIGTVAGHHRPPWSDGGNAALSPLKPLAFSKHKHRG
jgi:hypothetical protein